MAVQLHHRCSTRQSALRRAETKASGGRWFITGRDSARHLVAPQAVMRLMKSRRAMVAALLPAATALEANSIAAFPSPAFTTIDALASSLHQQHQVHLMTAMEAAHFAAATRALLRQTTGNAHPAAAGISEQLEGASGKKGDDGRRVIPAES